MADGLGPRFSISVPVRGGVSYLPSALTSLALQDGLASVALMDASGDPSVSGIADDHSNLLAYRRHASDDDGQSAAINEGWDRLTEPLVGWLNADDVLLPGALAKVAAVFDTEPDTDIVYGHGIFVDGTEAFAGYFPSISMHPEDLDRSCVICQPACFVRRRAMAAVGGLRAGLCYTMDWDFWLRLRDAGFRFRMLNEPLALVRNLKETKTYGGGWRRQREIDAILSGRVGLAERLRTHLGDMHYRAAAMGRNPQRLALIAAIALLARIHPEGRRERAALFGLSRHDNRIQERAEVALPVLFAGDYGLAVSLEGKADAELFLAGKRLELTAAGSGIWRTSFRREAGVAVFELKAADHVSRLRWLSVSPSPYFVQAKVSRR